MKYLRRLFYAMFPRYLRLELRAFKYAEADTLLRQNGGKEEGAQWRIAEEEDMNVMGVGSRYYVWLERRRRTTE